MTPAITSTQPRYFLIQIIVSSDLKFTVRSYYEGKDAGAVIKVNIGDRMAFLVQLDLAGGRKSIPYEITFSSSSFFGQPSLKMPEGGASAFLTVRTLLGRTSYSLNIPGLGCIFDPEIQSGSDGGNLDTTAFAPANFVATWDTGHNQMSFTKNGTVVYSPVIVHLNDKVTYTILNDPGSSFTINFVHNGNSWASPFQAEVYDFTSPLDAVTVQDYVEGSAGNPVKFPFTGSTLLGGSKLISPTYEIDLE